MTAPAPTGGVFADIAKKQEELIRKALDGSVFRAPLTADHVDASTLFDATGKLLPLPTGYVDQGLLNTDGSAFSRDVSTTDTNAFGRTTPVRVDVTADKDTMDITAIETSRATIEMGIGATIAANARGSNGALQIKKPSRPTQKQYKWLSIAVDESDAGEIYLARYFPRGKITKYGDQAYGGDNPIGWNVTVTGENDSAWGGPSSWIFGGPGWNALLVKMGFTALA